MIHCVVYSMAGFVGAYLRSPKTPWTRSSGFEQAIICYIVMVELSKVSGAVSDQLLLFSCVPEDFTPEVDWLDGDEPAHPFFDDALRVQQIICSIKAELLHNILRGCAAILGSLTEQGEPNISVLRQTLKEDPSLWRAIISAQRYGVVYLASRLEARQCFQPLVENHAPEADIIDSFLGKDAVAIRAINYGVGRYVTEGGLKIDNPACLVPPNAISSIGKGHVAVRSKDFERPSEELLAERNPLFDLHDFAHLTTAVLSPELFGNKYLNHLIKLPADLTALVRSPGMRSGKGSRISDGLLFSELLTSVFTQEVEAHIQKEKIHTYKSLTQTLAEILADYLLGGCPILHLSTQSMIYLDEPITPTQLAVLAQNKAYELPASEIEQRFFTRGGSDDRDRLFNMTTRQRIEFLAKSRSWTYFEVRNTIKHRAHKEAYRLVAMHFLENGVEVELSRKILENITYEDWRRGKRVDLWGLLV